MKAIDLIEELLSQHPHLVVNARTTNRDVITFIPIKYQGRRRLNSSVTYKVKCDADEAKFISSQITGVNSKGPVHFKPKEYVLLNIDLKHPRSINAIHEFLKKLQ
jgi:hypothetical protein